MEDERRLSDLERDFASLQPLQAKVMVLEAQIENMGREIGEMKSTMKDGFAEVKEDGKATRRVVMGFAFTIAASAIGVVIAVVSGGAG